MKQRIDQSRQTFQMTQNAQTEEGPTTKPNMGRTSPENLESMEHEPTAENQPMHNPAKVAKHVELERPGVPGTPGEAGSKEEDLIGG